MTWTRHGECNQCGACCQSIAMTPLVRDAEKVADRDFYDMRGFREVLLDGKPVLVLLANLVATCPQLTTEQTCGVYDIRPRTCREYPQNPLDVISKPCSYWFERDGVRMGGQASPYPTDIATMVRTEQIV